MAAGAEVVMGFREVTVLEIKEVLRLWLAGKGKKAIARQLEIDRNTVRRYLRAGVSCGLSQSAGESSLTDELLVSVVVKLKTPPSEPVGSDSRQRCEEQRAFIEKHLGNGVQLTKVRRLLQRQGVSVPYATLYRFAVRELGFGHAAPTIPVHDCEPGAEVQLDTGWMTLLEPDLFGKRRRFRAWIFTCVLSRHRFVHVCFRETTETAIQACEAAWGFFGGVFLVLIPDNTKAIVQRADPLKPLINPAFLEYSQARGFQIDPARSRSPKDKARVERTVPTCREDCFRGENLQTLDDAQRRANYWALDEYGMRRHTRTQRLPRECFETEEKPRLLPVPTEPYEVPIFCDPKVGPDQHAQVAKAIYSLPFDYRHKTLRARADRSTVRFYFNNQLVKTHPRKPPGGRSTDPNDFPPEKAAYAMRDCAFLLKQAEEKGANVARFAKALLEGPLPWARMRQCFALLGMCRRFTPERVDETCAVALAAEMHDIHRLERMLKLGRPTPKPRVLPAHVIPLARFLRPPSQYALPLASRERKNPNEGEKP
jgi:transposase